jgi:small subunit ribosomal protein S4
VLLVKFYTIMWRLDNVVLEWVLLLLEECSSHRHVTVNGEVVNIPSYHLKPGDKVAVRENLNH